MHNKQECNKQECKQEARHCTTHMDDPIGSHVDKKVNDKFSMQLNKQHGEHAKVKATRGNTHVHLWITFRFAGTKWGQCSIEQWHKVHFHTRVQGQMCNQWCQFHVQECPHWDTKTGESWCKWWSSHMQCRMTFWHWMPEKESTMWSGWWIQPLECIRFWESHASNNDIQGQQRHRN